jgi:rhodanese-related sulfurtransferase
VESSGAVIASYPDMQKLPVEDVKRRLDAGQPLIFIDARSDESWSGSDVQVPGSIRVPPDRADEFVGVIAPEATIITYCT